MDQRAHTIEFTVSSIGMRTAIAPRDRDADGKIYFGFPVADGGCIDHIIMLDHEAGDLKPSPFSTFADFVSGYVLRHS